MSNRKTKPAPTDPVGFFDSGVGGLCVRDAFIRRLPHEDTVYIADTANCPYGNRPPEEIVRLARRHVRTLLAHGCKMVVVACNTATAAAIDNLRATWPDVPFVGMEPAVKPAAMRSKSGVVGVLATQGTFNGRLYRETCTRFAKNTTVLTVVAGNVWRTCGSSGTHSRRAAFGGRCGPYRAWLYAFPAPQAAHRTGCSRPCESCGAVGRRGASGRASACRS